nr:MAG TPA: putative Ycf70-like protein [Caudoviricetes sp.]
MLVYAGFFIFLSLYNFSFKQLYLCFFCIFSTLVYFC